MNERRRDGQSHAGIVSAEVAREVLRRYRARGIGDRRLAELAGISRRTVHEVIAGRRTWIRQSVENRILTMRPSLAPGALVSAWRANRALQAMDAEGYERSFLAAQTPHAGRRLGALVRVSTERALIALYRRLTA